MRTPRFLQFFFGLLGVAALSVACGDSGGSGGGDSSSNASRPPVNFTSSFEAQRGSTPEAVLDGENWDDILGVQNLLTIVGPENGVNPIDGTSMLRIGVEDEVNAGIIAHDAIDLTSDNVYLRFYVNVQCIADDVPFTHYVQDCDTQLGLCDSRNFYWTTSNYSAATGRYRIGWQSYSDQRGSGTCSGNSNGLYLGGRVTSWGTIQNPGADIESSDDPNGLECDRWYRVEIRVACQQPGCFGRDRTDEVATRIHTRVYDDGGRQIIGDGQMRSMSLGGVWQGGTSGISMEEAYGDMNACYYMNSGRPSLHIGNNGQAGTDASAEAWMYFDSVATSGVDWIGP